MLKEFVIGTLLKPTLQRLGTAVGVSLLVGGDWLCANLNACGLVTADGADQVVRYVIAVALLAAELAWVWVEKRGKR